MERKVINVWFGEYGLGKEEIEEIVEMEKFKDVNKFEWGNAVYYVESPLTDDVKKSIMEYIVYANEVGYQGSEQWMYMDGASVDMDVYTNRKHILQMMLIRGKEVI